MKYIHIPYIQPWKHHLRLIAVNPSGEKLYVSNDGTIDVFDTLTDTQLGSIVNPAGSVSGAIAIASLEDPDWVPTGVQPALSFAPGAKYVDDPITGGRGIDQNKGLAGKERFNFRVLYTGPNDTTPQLWTVVDDAAAGKQISASMTDYNRTISFYPNLDLSDVDPVYRNGKYEDGEMFFHRDTFGKGAYEYHFEAIVGNKTIRTPKDDALAFTAGYSSVAFLPGVKASRLYKHGLILENQLWEPNRNADTQKLSVDENGKSVDKDIYTKTDANAGLLDEANIIPDPTGALQENFYKSFITFMDGLKSDKTIKDWRALPYDWRLAFSDVLSGGKAEDGKIYYDDSRATTTPYIYQELRNLADRSDSGKVTIVAHSMGGLLAKKLIADIEDDPNHPYRDLLGKIETVILVASPELGTPQALAAVLHGEGEDLPHKLGFFTSKITARTLAQSMHPAFDLFPLDAYLSRVKDQGKNYTTPLSLDPSIAYVTDDIFNGQTILGYYQNLFGGTDLTTASMLESFYLGHDGHGNAPDDDLIHPKVLSADFLNEANALHNRIDTWAPDPSENIRVVEVAGWGIKDTVKGIRYVGEAVGSSGSTSAIIPIGESDGLCTGHESGCKLDIRPVLTTDGDGTVVLPSAIAMGDETYFVDLYTYAEDHFISHSHASILEVQSLRDLIGNIIEEKEQPAQGLSYLYQQESDLPKNDQDPYLRLSIHSPVDVSITDAVGNHVGISPNSTPDAPFYDEQVPNSYYLPFGEGVYLGVPVATSSPYALELHGTGDGFFMLNVSEEVGDIVNTAQTFVHVPVTATTRATVALSSANSIGELALDQDGDGAPDVVVLSNESQADVTFGTLITALNELDIKKSKELVKKAKVAHKLFIKKNYEASRENLLSLKKKMNKGHETPGTLRITAMADVLLGRIPSEHDDENNEQKKEKKEKKGRDDDHGHEEGRGER